MDIIAYQKQRDSDLAEFEQQYSILKQKYSNFHIYVCYDNMESHNYVKYYEALYKNITVFFVKNDSTNKYKFNLYNNELMSKVTDGFILFLDDDDVFDLLLFLLNLDLFVFL